MLTSGQWEIAMPSKTTSALSVVLISLILILAACQPEIKRSRKVEDAASPLLGGLIQETDLSGEWRWIAEDTAQQAEEPTPQNQGMIESATRILTGDWGVQQYYITIAHNVERYPQDPPHPQVDSFQSTRGLTNTATLSPNLVPRGEAMSAKCWKASRTTVCDIVTSYSHLLSYVVVLAPAEMSDAALVELLNLVLNQADQRIKAMVP